MFKLETSPKKPVKLFTEMITNEVPTAIFIGSFDSITNAGIIRNPPPAPTNPVKSPTKAPSNRIRG